MLKLSARLMKIAGFIPDGARLADVGTDHAKLPVYLMQTGRIKSAVCTDIAEGPLKSAAKTVNRYGAGGIKLVLCDGLSEVSPDEADYIIIAGMGGELISEIIKKAAWLKDRNKTLILQPMSSADDLRIFLAGSGFGIVKEQAVEDGGKIYSVIKSEYLNNGEPISYPPQYPFAGGIDPAYSKIDYRYIITQRDRLARRLDGIKKSAGNMDISGLSDVIKSLNNMLEESDYGQNQGNL